ncbi:molybdopterin-dependent oxidoreductase [Chloroflexota bacterium]
MLHTEGRSEMPVRTACSLGCGTCCGLLAHVKDGVLTRVEPADFPDSGNKHICAKGLLLPKLVYHPKRLKYPMKRMGRRGEGKWRRISWDEALETIAERLGETSERYGSRSLAWATDGASQLGMAYFRFAGCCQGSAASVIGYGDAAGPCGDRVSFGTLWGEGYSTGFEKSELVVIWGNNPAETQTLTMSRIMDARERGAKVIAIDPRFTATASKADEYVPIRPGTDAALALGMINFILERGLEDSSFIRDHTVGPLLVNSQNGLFVREGDVVSGGSHDRYVVWDPVSDSPRPHDTPGLVPSLTGTYRVGDVECRPAFQLLAEVARGYPPQRVSDITGVPVDTIKRLAVEHVERKPVASYRGFGMQRTFHGDLSFRAVTALSAITGNIDLKGWRFPVTNMRSFLRAGGAPLLHPHPQDVRRHSQR